MTVLAPPRPPGPGAPREAPERRREQEALIKEARRRARQRRQRTAALLLLAAFLATAIGSTHRRGGHAGGTPGAADPVGQSKGAARNGKIAFADGLGLQVVDLDGSASVIARCPRSPGGCALERPAWSPDGRQIAYISGSVGLPPVPRGHPVSPRWHLGLPPVSLRHPVAPRSHPTLSLYVKDVASGRVRRLAGCGYCATQWQGAGLGWSPDGSWIAFSGDSGPHGAQSLWLVDTNDGTTRRLTDCRPQWCVDVNPAWAPSEPLILFSRLTSKGSSLYTVRADGSQLTRLTDSRFADHPQWSPDGRQIAFDGDNEIYVANADGSDQRLLFAGGTAGSGPGMPSWSPDGTQLAFFNTPRMPGGNRPTMWTITRDGSVVVRAGPGGGYRSEVWTINPDGSAKGRLYRSAFRVDNWAPPIWSPDGQQLAFATTSARGIFVIAPDGSNLHRISNASTSTLSWQRLP